jgi:hypothetical protein
MVDLPFENPRDATEDKRQRKVNRTLLKKLLFDF